MKYKRNCFRTVQCRFSFAVNELQGQQSMQNSEGHICKICTLLKPDFQLISFLFCEKRVSLQQK